MKRTEPIPAVVDPKWSLFVKVAELGSVSHAAATMNQPQSVISRQIGVLERDCGARLFRRTGRGVVLTELGKQVFPRVKALIAQSEQLSDDIRTSNREPVGTVRLGVLPSLVPIFAGALLKAVRQRCPRVQMHFTEGSSVQLEDWLNQGRLDLALILREDEEEEPGEPTLRKVSLSLIGPLGDPITSKGEVDFARVTELPLILPGEPHLLRARLDALAAQRHLQLRIQVEADSINLQEELVAAGGGYAIVAIHAPPAGTSPRFSSARIVNPALIRRIVLSTTVLRPHTLASKAVSQLIFSPEMHTFI